MGKRSWTPELEDGQHTVELEHGYVSGKRLIRISLLSLGGVIPMALGLFSGLGCVLVARDPSKTTRARVLWCVGITDLVWVLWVVLSIATALLRG